MSIANIIRKFIESSSRASYLASVTLPGLPVVESTKLHQVSHWPDCPQQFPNEFLICQVSGCLVVAWDCSQTAHHSPSKAMQISYRFACVSMCSLTWQLRDLNSSVVFLTLGRTSLVLNILLSLGWVYNPIWYLHNFLVAIIHRSIFSVTVFDFAELWCNGQPSLSHPHHHTKPYLTYHIP